MNLRPKGADMRVRLRGEEGAHDMGLKTPGIITFMLSVILTVIVLMSKFFGAEIPGITGNESWAMLGAYTILMLGCMVRGM
ncbi:MAG: hypothetical protein ABWZ19_01695 [Hyphomicrobium sp.]